MNTYSKVNQVIENEYQPCLTESVALKDSLGRILQEDIMADMNMPPFNKSAMDGYACRRSDLDNKLEILEVVQARNQILFWFIGKPGFLICAI